MGVANIELTHDVAGYPNNCVHFNVITDDPRSEREIRELFKTACTRAGLDEKDFGIVYFGLPDGIGYFEYFTKCAKRHIKKIILFKNEKELGAKIQRFYMLGTWFGEYKNGVWVEKRKKTIWNEYLRDRYGTPLMR